MSGLFDAIAAESPQWLGSSEENAKRAEEAAAKAEGYADDASASAAEAALQKDLAVGVVTGVALFNDRYGDVKPLAGDYTAAMVGARPSTWVPAWDDVTGKPIVASLTDAQTFIGVNTFSASISTDKKGFLFGNNKSSLSYNDTTKDVELAHGDSGAIIGVSEDGKLFSRPSPTADRIFYESSSDSFSTAYNASYKFKELTSGGTDYSLNQQDGSVFTLTLEQTTTNISLAPINTVGNSARQITIFLTQGAGGSKKVVWGNNIKWSQGRAPILSLEPSTTDVISFLTLNNGLSWFGFFQGGYF